MKRWSPPLPLRLTDRLVSRRHCEIVSVDEGVVLRDTSSRNGTFVNGVRIFDVALESGAQVWLGETRIRCDIERGSQRSAPPAEDRFGDLLGAGPAMRQVFATLRSIAPTMLTCLLLGETGTGKELAARAVHLHSRYAHGPFVVIDLGAVSEGLIEDKLFGHERGAFTGAQNAAKGAFEDANGGTVFLDEIGELPLSLQPKLLRVLERREVTRLGSHRPIPCDIRVIAATHRDLEAMVAATTFRQDLFYRISEASVRLPPLRERLEDIESLARHMLTQDWSKPASLTPGAVQALLRHQWPGNVRELRNVLRRANATSQSGSIDVELLRNGLGDRGGEGRAPQGIPEESLATIRRGSRGHRAPHARAHQVRTPAASALLADRLTPSSRSESDGDPEANDHHQGYRRHGDQIRNEIRIDHQGCAREHLRQSSLPLAVDEAREPDAADRKRQEKRVAVDGHANRSMADHRARAQRRQGTTVAPTRVPPLLCVEIRPYGMIGVGLSHRP
jgi:DNA-binding NtrC family response regulator